MSWSLRLVVIVLVIGLGVWGVRTYSSWIREQVETAVQVVDNEAHVLELAVKFRNAQDLLQAGKPGEAKTLLEEVAAVSPDYAGLEEELAQTENMIALDTKYNQAIGLINLNDVSGALDILVEIEAEEPFYRDVSLRISEIKSQSLIGDILTQADRAYEAEEWATAASKYETVRALDPSYEPEVIDERLFDSYINAAQETVSEDTESLEAINIAEEYFRKALALRPQDPEIMFKRQLVRETVKSRLFRSYVNAAQLALTDQADSLQALTNAEAYFNKALEMRPDDPEVITQQALARSYLGAQDDFNQGRWSEVISELEYVYVEDRDYAGGTARQTLYEAYMARGNSFMVIGEYENGLADFQQAALLAEQDPESKVRLFEAQIHMAEAQGAVGNYEEAVQIFRTAIDDAELAEADLEERQDLLDKLETAESYAGRRNYRTAFKHFREAGRRVLFLYPSVTYVVQSGDYLTSLASRYHTTVDAIAQANDLDFSKKITIGQELVIPVRQP
jgi:tetratricopeptide (TPR) repeat protein